ncbi:response regulator [Clostridium sp. MCC353]|uniref:response regulator transcription factor n=1 Tax=Clostridium sp. MCC353 TaxID=2592646 RepID=UPI001C011985|nr:response regulator [Clostridium sp. MCC353]MBT9777913.1 response regulator [Clostridium sp. MCC353]
MLKLIIADDERIIRETISHLIDWNSIGIELAGVCKDGIEAYNMILDESPDIVLTDIKMPGLSGLELVQRISQTDLDTQFILLSGYGEFSYAKEAMKYGLRHYLLKPCNEEQIIASVKEVIDDCYHKRATHRMQEQQKLLLDNLHTSIITSIINEGVASDGEYDGIFHTYSRFLDFSSTGYELYYLYFLEEQNLSECFEQLQIHHRKNAPGIPLHGIYVHNTLLLFFQSYQREYSAFEELLDSLNFEEQAVALSYKRISYENLNLLLATVLNKVRRYGTIFCMNGPRPVPTCNYKNLIQIVEDLCVGISGAADAEHTREFGELTDILNGITNVEFLKQLVSNILIRFSTNSALCSPIVATELMLELNQMHDVTAIRSLLTGKLREMLRDAAAQPSSHGDLIDKTIAYVNDHLSNPNLTLKWIAENYLYMNVDYVSKKFIRETGSKFSNFLTELRIQKAKELLTGCDSEKIQYVAEQVGCGNNPQYFSQIFKKNTGMTPSAYAKKMNGGT